MTGLGFETGFAVILASDAGEIERCRAWAMERGSREIQEHGPIRVFRFTADPSRPQGWSNGDGSGVCSGELYELGNLKSQLVAAGLMVPVEPEALLRAAYAHWGKRLFDRLAGAFSIINLEEQRAAIGQAGFRSSRQGYAERHGGQLWTQMVVHELQV